MYFPIGWPRVLKIPELGKSQIRQVACNLDKILFAILTDDTLAIWFCKPCVPIVFHRRTPESINKVGLNCLVEWKPDSSMLAVATTEGHLIMYKVGVIAEQRSLYIQTDSPHANLRRDSAELFIREIIPPLHISLGGETLIWDGLITSMVCITMTEIMMATTTGHILRYRWDGTQNRDYCLDLRRIPFCINKQVSRAEPIIEENTHVNDMEYSPLVGGFAVTLNDGRAAFLTASSLKFDPNTVQGIWAQNIEDATCASVNHKFRLIAFGRENGQCIVYIIDESTGGLEVSHECALSGRDYPGCPGAVSGIRWTPDGCAMAAAWQNGGVVLWSTFGALLVCTLGWDYGLNVDLNAANPLAVISMDFSAEGYQLWMVHKQFEIKSTGLIQLDFVKSALTVNPCMSQQPHLYLQGDDRLYVNLGDSLLKGRKNDDCRGINANIFQDRSPTQSPPAIHISTTLAEARQWLVISMPDAYSATNWPVKYTAIDFEGQNIAVSGRTGLAHYSLQTRKWKLFGNETQEKDFIVTGGLLWWRDYVVLGSYSIIDNNDELRFYPKDCKLDNKFAKIIKMAAQVLLLNCLHDHLITFCSDAVVSVYGMKQIDAVGNVELMRLQAVDVSALCVHPTCVVSVALSTLRTEPGRDRGSPPCQSMVLNVSGRLLMVQRDRASPTDDTNGNTGLLYTCGQATVLASNVETVWVPGGRSIGTGHKPHLTEALWLACGALGMRVWLPLFPRRAAPQPPHAFISKRIMLPFQLNIYPLAILFEDAIILGAENDTMLYTSDPSSPFSLPFCFLERTSQVYLHQILRQLIRRNLGYNAWEIARSCINLPYFPHSLELLLHEVLEEEATSKDPIPDAQLPSVIEFISEFPVYLQTVVQCARKTEIALWPYLFSAAGKPKHLFQECMTLKQLDTAASYLIILQNLEASTVSRQYATLLLDTALEQSKWELAKELVRFLRAIDPNDVESPRNSFIMPSKLSISQQTPPVSPNAEDLSLVLGSMQVARNRSYSTTNVPKVSTDQNHKSIVMHTTDPSPVLRRKKSMPISTRHEHRESTSGSAEEFFIDVILQRHARRLLSTQRIPDLGHFAARLDFHLVAWLAKERDRAGRIDDFISALKQLHEDFSWPYPDLQTPVVFPMQRVSTTVAPTHVPDSPNIDDRIKSLRVETTGLSGSQVGDSGYMSFPGGLPCTGLVTPVLSVDTQCTSSALPSSECDLPSSVTLEAQLSAKIPRDLRSVLSNTSEVWPDDRDEITVVGNTSVDSWNDVPSTQLLEQLSHQIANRGSSKSEVQLRYLLQLFMEASCLEWSLLISILLRDAMAVLRTVNAARSPDQSVEAVRRLKDGIQILYHWTLTECLGYKPFMVAIQNQISVLTKLLTSKQEHLQQMIEQSKPVLPSSQVFPGATRSRRTSSNHDNTSQSGGSTSNHRIGSVSSSVATTDRISETTFQSNASGPHDPLKRSRDLDREIIVEHEKHQTDAYSCVIS